MKTMKTKPSTARILSIAGVASAMAVVSTAIARPPFTEEELAVQKDALYESVQKGYDLWHGSKSSMTSNGLACGNCHPDTAASNPQTFPKYMTMYGKVVPWQEMANWCIENPQLGERLDLGGEDMTSMMAYAMYLHRGKPIQPGLATEQTVPVVVEYGTGFRRDPTGLGVDTRHYEP
jgi:thiosulfate dehydrogenase